jgi:hypothetical protein
MYLIIWFKRLKLFYLFFQFNYCIYTNSLPLWWWLSWSWLFISHLDNLLDFRGAGGCDSPLVVVHVVQYFSRLWIIVTSVNMKPSFAIWCNCVEYCGPCGNQAEYPGATEVTTITTTIIINETNSYIYSNWTEKINIIILTF